MVNPAGRPPRENDAVATTLTPATADLLPGQPTASDRPRRGVIERRVYTLRESAAYLGLSERTTYKYVVTGEIAIVKYPNPERDPARELRGIRIDKADLDAFIDRHRQPW
jgi:hypothetical protein